MAGVQTDRSRRFFFTAEQLADSPSRKCGMAAETELMYRQSAAKHIQEMGQELRVTQLCINTAIVYMHRFYAFHSLTLFHRHNVAVACLLLAAKAEDQPRKLADLIKYAASCLNQKPPDPNTDDYEVQVADVSLNENLLLQTLGFDVAVEHPHVHVLKTCSMINASKELKQTSYDLASSSLRFTTMCLQYKPAVVACFCIHLACKWARYEIPVSKDGKQWFEYVDESITLDLLNRMTEEFLLVYNQRPRPSPSDSVSPPAAKSDPSTDYNAEVPSKVPPPHHGMLVSGGQSQLSLQHGVDKQRPPHGVPDQAKQAMPLKIRPAMIGVQPPQQAPAKPNSKPTTVYTIPPPPTKLPSYQQHKEKYGELKQPKLNRKPSVSSVADVKPDLKRTMYDSTEERRESKMRRLEEKPSSLVRGLPNLKRPVPDFAEERRESKMRRLEEQPSLLVRGLSNLKLPLQHGVHRHQYNQRPPHGGPDQAKQLLLSTRPGKAMPLKVRPATIGVQQALAKASSEPAKVCAIPPPLTKLPSYQQHKEKYGEPKQPKPGVDVKPDLKRTMSDSMEERRESKMRRMEEQPSLLARGLPNLKRPMSDSTGERRDSKMRRMEHQPSSFVRDLPNLK